MFRCEIDFKLFDGDNLAIHITDLCPSHLAYQLTDVIIDYFMEFEDDL